MFALSYYDRLPTPSALTYHIKYDKIRYIFYDEGKEKTMKLRAFYKILLAVLLCAALVAVFAACNEDDVKDAVDGLTEQTGVDLTAAQLVGAQDFTITDTALSMSVANSVESYSFIGKVTVSEGATWQICADQYGSSAFATKTVPLNEGDNTYYLVVTSGDGEHISVYSISIHRVAVYTVTFDTAGGTAVTAQQVEEGKLATRPTADPERAGYIFTGWDYDFSQPITAAQTITACWQAFFIRNGGSITELTNYAKGLNLATLTIPSTIDGVAITSIGEGAFAGCTGLTSVTIGNGVTSIGRSAFSGCTNLTSVTIPSSVRNIGNYAFQSCIGLTSITIPNSVTSIGDNAFFYCTGLTSITIPDSVTIIGEGAFSRCTGLTSVTIPNSVTSIDSWAFSWCTGLTSITVADGNTVYHSAGNCVIETASKTLIAGCRNSVIPTDGSVTSIGDSAFSGCIGLTSITIPNSVTSIGDSVFFYCTGLTSITIPDSVTSIDDSAFSGCTGLTNVTYQGTQAQWSAISKGTSWDNYTGNYTIHCTDGDITKS